MPGFDHLLKAYDGRDYPGFEGADASTSAVEAELREPERRLEA